MVWQKTAEAQQRINLNADQMVKSMVKVVDLIEADFQDVVDWTALDLWSGIIENNPVDTGRSQANWQMDNKLNDKVFDKNHDPKAGNLKDDIIWIFNNVDYVEYLEAGTETRPPVGFIAGEIQRINSNFKKLLKANGLV